MACGMLTSEVQRHLTAVSTTTQYEWYTDWMPAIGLDSVRAVIKNKAVSGNFQGQLAIQVAAVRTNAPSSPATLDQLVVGSGERCTGDIDVTSQTTSAFFVRFGVAFSLSSGSTPGQADVSLQVAFDACGKVVGSSSSEVVALDTANYFLPATQWLPAVQTTKVKAAMLVTSSGPNFKSRLATQTGTTSIESPDGWSTTFDSWRTGDQEINTGELTPTTTGKMWIRFGVQYTATSGSNKPAQITAVTAARS